MPGLFDDIPVQEKKGLFDDIPTVDPVDQAIQESFERIEVPSSVQKTNEFIDKGGLQEIYRDLPFESVSNIKRQIQVGGASAPDLEHLVLRERSKVQGLPLVRDLPEIGEAPEMNELTKGAAAASLGANFTFRDEELGKILQEQLGAEIGQDIEGNYFARMPSGSYAINRPGFSGQDVAKTISAIGAFTPASRGATLTRQALGGMATQGVIEGGQKALGGDINPEDVAMAGAGPVIMNKGAQAIKAALKPLKGRSPAVAQYFDDAVTDDSQLLSKWDVANKLSPARRETIRKGINEGTIEGVGWKVDPKSGRIVADNLERELVRKGVRENLVRLTKPESMSRGDRAAAKEMIQKAKNRIRGVKGSERDIPQSVIGKNAMKRFDVIRKAQKEASDKIGKAVEKDLKGKPVNISDIVDDFDDALSEFNISVRDNGTLDFSQSLIKGSNVGPIRNVHSMLKSSYDDAAELHKAKRAISNQINYGKRGEMVKPIDSEAEDVLKAVRGKINERLRDMSDDYASANDEFRTAAEAVVPFAKEMGRRFDPESDRVESLVGQELRKLITNYAKADDLITVIDDLDATARQFGGEFDDDIMAQVMLNQELQRVFGSFKPGSMQGIMQSAADATTSRYGIPGQIAKDVGRQVEKRVSFGPPTRDQLELIQDLEKLVNR